MFTLETRMSDALAERPALRQVLPAFHPAFAKLTHPVLGKILPRLVNVADAARVAGVDPQTLLDVMNLSGPPPAAMAPAVAVPRPPNAPAPGWLRGEHILDVRPELASGVDPFVSIMGELRTLAPGVPLTVLVPFEPAPLLRLLSGKGWVTYVVWDGETCRASFWKPPEGLVDATGGERPAPDLRLERLPVGAKVDVRGLEPPEPMRQVLAALDLGDTLPLLVVHDREPALLYPKLTARGLRWTVERLDGRVEIRIFADAPDADPVR